MSRVIRVYSIPSDAVNNKVASGWRFKRLFVWLRKTLPHHGESLLIAFLIQTFISKWTYAEVKAVVDNEVRQKLPPSAKNWLYSIGGYTEHERN